MYNPANNPGNIEHLEMANLVENLVSLRAKKASIDQQVKHLEDTFKRMMVEQDADSAVFESYDHYVGVTEIHTTRTAWKTIAEHYKPSAYMMEKYSNQSTSIRLTVSTKSKKVA